MVIHFYILVNILGKYYLEKQPISVYFQIPFIRVVYPMEDISHIQAGKKREKYREKTQVKEKYYKNSLTVLSKKKLCMKFKI